MMMFMGLAAINSQANLLFGVFGLMIPEEYGGLGESLLTYALAVAEEQSFTQAAARLHLAQPSLSRQVRLLEHELVVVLFNRGPGQGPVTLTPDGAALLPFMQRVLSDV